MNARTSYNCVNKTTHPKPVPFWYYVLAEFAKAVYIVAFSFIIAALLVWGV